MARRIEGNIECAVIVWIGNSRLPRAEVVRGKDTADECDQHQRLSAVVAQSIEVPPRVARRLDRRVEDRSSRRLAAARRPDRAAIGTPGPGCTLPPARY